ncbi:MAG TPA: DUF4288 domain-containing protein [Candidatus Omnitrophota bacterium]|nr:DUF4288 domain-containing protein [Candidatus Omnitrophota bacterium]HPB67755.1 DUF4288 domain-containing protein [Candidatus Omnitrophota bacterium]HQO58746.1 DUF4288 domain-containing protein [Candidatus Omnitrophota bacterium]
MPVKWFSVKTLYRITAQGLPEKPDLSFDPDATLVEERILLIKAHHAREAIAKAEREAVDYARRRGCVNPYNQKMCTTYLGFYDIIELSGILQDKTEVFFAARLVSRKVSDQKIARIYIGKRRGAQQMIYKKFVNKEYKMEGK